MHVRTIHATNIVCTIQVPYSLAVKPPPPPLEVKLLYKAYLHAPPPLPRPRLCSPRARVRSASVSV